MTMRFWTHFERKLLLFVIAFAISLGALSLAAQSSAESFRVIAFYTGKNDKAHISFVP